MSSKQGPGRLVAGLGVVVAGVLLLLGTLDVLDFDIGEIFGWVAAILLIAFGLGILVTQRFRRVFFPIVLIGFGTFILLENLDIDAYQYWPVILILVGGAVIFGNRRRRSDDRRQHVGKSARTTSDGDLNIVCTLGEAHERVESDDFSGGKATVTMGNVNLDLRDAAIVGRPATLEVSVTMGGLHLRVPSEWVVNMENVVTMGESEDKRTRRETTSSGPDLIISGKVTMGSLAVND